MINLHFIQYRNVYSVNLVPCLVFFLGFSLIMGCTPASYEPGEDPKNDSALYKGLKSEFHRLNSVILHTLEGGLGPSNTEDEDPNKASEKTSNKAKSILFLHGFPYFAGSWQPLMSAFAAQYHVVAVDQRGYGYSAKPETVEDYHLSLLVEDVRQLIQSRAHNGKAILVGHDWGGVVAWAVAQKYPELVEKLAVINAPPMNAFLYSLKHHKSQQEASRYVSKLASWYVQLLFKVKGPDLLWNEASEQLLLDKKITQEFKQAFLAAWSKPGAAQAAVNWYSANIPEFDVISGQDYGRPNQAKITSPSLLIWSKRDKAFTLDTFNEIPKWVDNLKVITLDTDSHAPQFEQPERIEAFLNAFIQQ